jgi:hypothetical protein
MNHKRGKPKSARAGCLMCKPYKDQKASKAKAKREIGGKGGFGKLRAEICAAKDMKDSKK